MNEFLPEVISKSLILADKKMHRGCLSDATESRLMCELDETGICMKCSSSGCNNHPKRGKPQFSCLKCSDDDGCTSGQNASESVPCTGDVTFDEEETCFTHAIAGNYQTISFQLSNILKFRFDLSFKCKSDE